jgi:hypothetical protein
MDPYDYRQEDHVREVERALMYIEQAQRKCEEIAASLAQEGAEDRLIDGLRTAAGALRAEHNRLLNRSHFPVPDGPGEAPATDGEGALGESAGDQESQAGADQQRMVI